MVDQIIQGKKEIKDVTHEVWMLTKVKEVTQCEVFGEVVLVQPKSRSTIAIADTRTELLCLTFDSYTRIIEKAIKKDLFTRTRFLRQFRIFSQMT